MSEVWSLPGYDVQALLGSGATGEVWRARELATGDTVALKRLKQDADLAAVEALRREAALLRGLDTPYVVRLRAVVGAGADLVLVLDHAAGGSLAALLARRGALDPGEVVTIAGPLAQGLAAAHARGLVHGDLTPSNVLFTAEGMPLLSDLGLARLAGAPRRAAAYLDPAVASGGEPDAAADVWALAAPCHHMLAGAPPHERADVDAVLSSATAAPRALVAAIEAGLEADPATRPDAAAFAALIRRAHAAAPVQLQGAGPVSEVRRAPSAPAHARPRSLPQGALLGVGALSLLVVAALVGWVSGRSGNGPAALPQPVAASASATHAASSPAWPALLEELDSARAQAFSSGETSALSEVYAAGSPGLAADTALLRGLAERGQTAHGLRHSVRSVQVLESSDDAARLRVVDTLGPYEIRDAAGDVVSRASARGERSFVVELTRTSDGWRLVQVRPAPAR